VAHYASADMFRLLNYVVGIPAVVFSSIVGTAILDRVRKEINRGGQDAPELNVRLWKREAKRFGVKEPLDLP
jgi:hypothetical protein